MIRNVNGMPVYVIETPKADAAKTSRGIGYGSLVSQLRWQLWEEVQKNELRKAQFEQLAQESQLRVYEQQRRDLSRAIREARKLKADVQAKRISPNAALSRAKAQAQLDLQAAKANVALAEKEAKSAGVEVTEKEFLDIVGEPAVDPVTGKRLTLRTVKARPQLKLPRVQAPRLPEVEATPAEAGVTVEDELDQLINQLQTELDGLEAPELGQAPDVLQRTRRGFEREIGVGGFGLAPRRLKTRPRFEEQPAVAQLDEVIADRERQAVQAAAMRKAETQRARAAELSVLGEEYAIPQDAALTPEEIVAAKREGRAAAVEELRGAGALPAKPEQFLDIERNVRLRRLRRSRRRAAAGADAAGADAAGAGAAQPAPVEDPEAARRRERAAELAELGVKPEGEIPVAPRPQAMPMIQFEDVPAHQPSPAIQPEAVAPSERPLVPPSLVEEARAFWQDADIGEPRFPRLEQRRMEKGKAPLMGNKPLRFESEEQMVDEYLKEKQRREAPVQGAQKPTKQARRDRYAMKVLKRGADLAKKPKKLERIAKTNLSLTEKEGKVAEYITITDKLMAVNKGKPNAMKLAYDELSRHYKDDPSAREDAHSYLIAMSIMNEDIAEPV